MYTNTLHHTTSQVLQKLALAPAVAEFYLSGGTALALQLGHRISEDLDFFATQTFDPVALQAAITPWGQLTDAELSEGTLNAYMDTVKLQFLHYPYPLLEKLVPYEGIQLSSVIDIACTKIITISMRGSKKDFIDLYFLLEHFTLPTLMTAHDQKYQGVSYNQAHVLKSLVYFADADLQPAPRLLRAAAWPAVKEKITQTVKAYQLF